MEFLAERIEWFAEEQKSACGGIPNDQKMTYLHQKLVGPRRSEILGHAQEQIPVL